MKTLALRLQHALTVRKKTPADLSRATGKTESAVSQWLNGKTKSMRGDSLMTTSAFLRCNAPWLSGNKGPSGLEDTHDSGSETHTVQERTISYMDRPTGGALLMRLGAILSSMDATDRGMAALLLRDLAEAPTRASELADKFDRLLGELPAAVEQHRAMGGN